MPDMTATTAYRMLLAWAANALAADDDPDGPVARQALLLALRAGTHRADGPGSADWDLYCVAVTEAVRELQAGLDEPVILAAGSPGPGPDSVELRGEVAGLVRRLADRYAAAAAVGNDAPAWRRLVWARVAHRLDDAVAELT